MFALANPLHLISHHFRLRFWLPADAKQLNLAVRQISGCGASARGIPQRAGKPQRKKINKPASGTLACNG